MGFFKGKFHHWLPEPSGLRGSSMASTCSGPSTTTATWRPAALELEHAPEPPGGLKSQMASSRSGVGPLQFANLTSSQMVLMPLVWGPPFEHPHRASSHLGKGDGESKEVSVEGGLPCVATSLRLGLERKRVALRRWCFHVNLNV